LDKAYQNISEHFGNVRFTEKTGDFTYQENDYFTNVGYAVKKEELL